MKLQSSDFSHEGIIPNKFTCDGQDISPDLSWTGVPEGTQSLALICDDPDAPMGTWDHWIVFNISPQTTHFPQSIISFPKGTQFGKNSWGRQDYGGPCATPREARLFFNLYCFGYMHALSDRRKKHQ